MPIKASADRRHRIPKRRHKVTIARWKCVVGGGLRSQTDGRQATEVAVATGLLNRMLELGRPEYVRIA